MPRRSPAARLTDIVEAIEHVYAVPRDVPLEDFEKEWQTRWLVERGVEIIPEASRHLPADLKARHREIPWSKVAGIGNVLGHGYEFISAAEAAGSLGGGAAGLELRRLQTLSEIGAEHNSTIIAMMPAELLHAAKALALRD